MAARKPVTRPAVIIRSTRFELKGDRSSMLEQRPRRDGVALRAAYLRLLPPLQEPPAAA